MVIKDHVQQCKQKAERLIQQKKRERRVFRRNLELSRQVLSGYMKYMEKEIEQYLGPVVKVNGGSYNIRHADYTIGIDLFECVHDGDSHMVLTMDYGDNCFEVAIYDHALMVKEIDDLLEKVVSGIITMDDFIPEVYQVKEYRFVRPVR